MTDRRKRANGESSIQQVFYTYVKVDGRRKQIKRKSRKELLEALEELKQKHGNISSAPIHSKWMAQVTIGYKPNGSPNRKTFYFDTRKEAQAKVAEVLHKEMNQGDTLILQNNLSVPGLWSGSTNIRLFKRLAMISTS